VYQGEELGLTEAELPYEALRDPYGITFWPEFKGRDGCRTPMPWGDGEHAGFSDATPWLPVPSEHRVLNVARQQVDPASALNGYRRFMHWRRDQPALRLGSIRFLDTPEPVLAFVRELDGERVLAVFNLSAAPVEFALPLPGTLQPLQGHGLVAGTLDGGRLQLPANGSLFAQVT
jgi:alpha-glucosidase